MGAGGYFSGFISNEEKKEDSKIKTKHVDEKISDQEEGSNLGKEISFYDTPDKEKEPVGDTLTERSNSIHEQSSGGESNNENSSQEGMSEVKKECRLHKLMSSFGAGRFEATNKEKLKQEILKNKKGNYYPQIEEACDKVGEKDIFVSNKNSSGWKYYPEDQEDKSLKGKFQKYLEGVRRS